MALIVFKLTKFQRDFFRLICSGFNLIQIILAVIVLCTCIYVYYNVSPKLFSEKAEINFVFFTLGSTTIFVICNSCIGFRLAENCIKQPEKKSTQKLFSTWAYISLILLFYTIILALMGKPIGKHILRSMKHTLEHGMKHYLIEEIWKITIDKIQTELQCCGIYSYQDWHSIQWLNRYHINSKSLLVKKFRNYSHTGTFPITPWSCCKINFPHYCYHDPLQQTGSREYLKESINEEGCAVKLRTPIETGIIVFIIFVIVNTIIQILCLLVCRILYTSCRNAYLLNSPDGKAAGWLFGRGDCGIQRGKTLSQIMLTRKHDENEKRISDQDDMESLLKSGKDVD